MNPKMIWKLAVDMGMTVALLLLMAYELVWQAAHEWIGIGMFVLFIIHHILNGSWSGSLLKGNYHPVRIMQTGLVLLILCAMVGLMISGTILSRHALAFLPIKGGRSFAILALVIAGYGVYAFIKRDIGDYMLLRSHFVFFDYEEPLVFFFLDYMAVMGLFIAAGHYVCTGLRSMGRGQKRK